ncbi:hypothetical protein [Gluconobacter oxydans]|uniref:hypothetical protein n=1 Tax=Gluconobacter oxydans TaxID=442 RepID=UPI0039E7398C
MLDVSQEKLWMDQLIEAGWEQGCIFAPAPEIVKMIPEFINFKEGQFLVVCTQTCSLLAGNFQKEPVVELLVADPIETYDANAPRAKGKENKNFHLPFASDKKLENKFEAVNCSISKRMFLPRNILCNILPIDLGIRTDTLKSFKGWIANYYMRVALPSQLVDRLKIGNKSSFKNAVTKVLKEKDEQGDPLHKGVRTFYVSWSPDYEEININKPYKILLRVICDKSDIEDCLQNLFDTSLVDYRDDSNIKNGIFLEDIIVSSLDNTTLDLIDGMFRFNFWDDLSSLTEKTSACDLD